MKQWNMKYRRHPDGFKVGVVEAGSRERAEAVGRRWCELDSAAKFVPTQFVGIEDPVLADESILKEAPPLTNPELPREVVSRDEQLRRLAQRNMDARQIPEDQMPPDEPPPAVQPKTFMEKVKDAVGVKQPA